MLSLNVYKIYRHYLLYDTTQTIKPIHAHAAAYSGQGLLLLICSLCTTPAFIKAIKNIY
jgi:hypothetical protein